MVHKSSLKSWRESASLILAAKTHFAPAKKTDDYNYNLLLIQRSLESGFMPSTFVFPGGTLSPPDSSKEWVKLYQNSANFDGRSEQSTLPSLLSERIAAIRETFEECGILLCKPAQEMKKAQSNWASFIGGLDIKHWQHKVHENPEEFLKLCLHFGIYPDIWALKEWGNWMTPPCMSTRFNTTFFLAVLDQKPPTYPEKNEVQHIQWASPASFLRDNKDGDTLLPPPQFYEISRIASFFDIDRLSDFANERIHGGLERYWPYRIETDEGLYSILPGDDLYPKEIDPSDESVPFVAALPKSRVKNRILHKDFFRNILITENFAAIHEHVIPANKL